MELNLKFKTKLSHSVKFFYPWETTENEGAQYISLNEEIIELIWNNGDYQERIAAILKKQYYVLDWDWEDDVDEYIEVFFKDTVDSDQLAHDIEYINREFSNLWDELVVEAREKIAEYQADEEPEAEAWDNRIHTQPDNPPSNIWDTKEPDEWDTKSHKPADRLKVWNR